jgi:DNA-binding SARP family transcriptional activator
MLAGAMPIEAPAPAPAPRLLLAGAPALQQPGQPPLPLAPQDALLLAWLALEGPTARARLAALMWPDSDAEAARNSLRQRLFKLRRLCGLELVCGSQTLALAPGLQHDLAETDSLLGAEPLAVTGELAAWLEGQRRRRQDRLLQQLQNRAEAAESGHRWAEALALAAELLALQPYSEAAHRRVMRLHYLAGDRTAALLAFDRCESVLKNEVGTRPDAETLALLRLVEGGSTPQAARGPASLPASVLRPPRLVGREAEIHSADHAWARGQVVALVGEAGMGKSRLLQHLLPPQALAVAARPGDAGVPLSTLARLLRALAERSPLSIAPPARQELARVLPEWLPDTAPGWEGGGATAGGGRRLQLQRAVASVLAACADLPALALDDLHFADTASLQLLQALLDEAPGPQRWALAYRPAEAGSALQALNESLLDQARLQAVVLQPLGLAALAALVDSLGLPGVHGATLAPGLLARTGGNPLYALETLKQAWVDEQLAGGAGRSLSALADARTLPRPLSVLRLVEKRLAQLTPPALALARCVAVAGQDFSPALATQVLGTPTLALADAWAELEQAQILRDQAFVHDLFEEAALNSVPAALARHLHGEIAAHLETAGRAAPARLARHWLQAGQPARAAPHLERAAQVAARALEPAEAARLWGQLAELRASAGQAEAAFDAAEQAVLLLRSATAGPELESAIRRMQGLARTALQHARGHDMQAVMLHMRGDAAGAAASVTTALAVLGPDGPWQARADLLNMRGVVLRRSGDIAQARAAFEQALALFRQAAAGQLGGEPGAAESEMAPTLNNLGLLLQDEDEHEGAITLLQEAAERQPDPLVRARVINNLAISLEARGQAALAHERCLSAARLAGGAAGVVAINLQVRLGVVSRTLGRWREALAHLAEAEALMRNSPSQREEELHLQRARLWLELGRPALAQEALERAGALCANLPVVAAEVVSVRARLALLQGRDARAELQAAADTLRATGQRRALRRLQLVLAQALPPADALALMLQVAQQPTVRSNACTALPVQVRLAQALLALQRPAEALRHAQRAADWLQALHPMDLTPSEVWLTLARCAEAAGDAPQAASAAEQGAALVQQQAAEHLDAPYVESFLQRNPVHRELLLRAAGGAALAPPSPTPPSAAPGP